MIRNVLLLLLTALIAGPASAANPEQQAFFPFGIYDKSELTPGTAEWHTYYHKLMTVLVDNNMNTLLTIPYWDATDTLWVMDQAHQRDIRMIMSVGNPLNPAWDYAGPGRPFYKAYKHPAVIAFKYGDEPKDEIDLNALRDPYAALRGHSRLPVLTAMVGESMDFSSTQIASKAWTTLRTEVRFARNYPMRRTFDLEDWSRDKMKLPFDEWARQMEATAGTPWWCILQTFGQGIEKSQSSYWRLPTSNELNAMAHIALANGARGFIGYALQDHNQGRLQGLVDDHLEARKARDGSTPLYKYRELGALVQFHAALLSRHRRANFRVKASSSAIIAVPRIDPQTGIEYVYLVNKNTEAAVSGTLRIESERRILRVKNIYADASAPSLMIVAPPGDYSWTLGPGEGQLWQLMTD